MKIIKFVRWAVIVHFITGAFGRKHDIWMLTFVESSSLEATDLKKQTYSSATVAACSLLTSKLEWATLFCFSDQQCLVSDLKIAFDVSNGRMTDPIQCWMKYTADEDVCASNPTRECNTDCCLKISTHLSWPDARQQCLRMGMDLVTNAYIETDQQISDIKTNFNMSESFWIGAHNPGLEVSTIQWIDGTSLNVNDPRWLPGTPQGNEEYTVVTRQSGLFDDYPADYNFPAICAYVV